MHRMSFNKKHQWSPTNSTNSTKWSNKIRQQRRTTRKVSNSRRLSFKKKVLPIESRISLRQIISTQDPITKVQMTMPRPLICQLDLTLKVVGTIMASRAVAIKREVCLDMQGEAKCKGVPVFSGLPLVELIIRPLKPTQEMRWHTLCSGRYACAKVWWPFWWHVCLYLRCCSNACASLSQFTRPSFTDTY